MANRAKYELQDDQTAVTEPQRQRIRYLRNKTRADAEEQELTKMAKYKEICEKRRTDMVVTKITKASVEQHAAAVHAVNAHTTMQLQQEIGSLRNALCELPQIAMGPVASSQLALANVTNNEEKANEAAAKDNEEKAKEEEEKQKKRERRRRRRRARRQPPRQR